MNLLDKVAANKAALSVAERRVARLVLDDPRGFSTLPVTVLAEKAAVSKPTVVRFCRSLGYEGLTDFKLKLAGSLNQGVPFIHTAVNEQDSTQLMIVKIIDNVVSALLQYRNEASSSSFQQAIDALYETTRSGGRVEFYGVGNSGFVAQDAQHKFFRLGGNTVAFSDGHVQIMAATMLGSKDCAVIISNSGRSRDLLDATEIAGKTGATTIVITASGSPLAGLGHILLAADHPEGYDRYSPMISRLLHLSIIDILTTGVALKIGPTLRPMLENIKKNLKNKRYSDA